jgi:hypothetical protein
MYDAVVVTPTDFGTADDQAVVLRFRGLLRDADGFHTIAFMLPSFPAVIAGLLTQAASAVREHAPSATSSHMPVVLPCSSAFVLQPTTPTQPDLVVGLEIAPGVALPVRLTREAAGQLYAGLAASLAN